MEVKWVSREGRDWMGGEAVRGRGGRDLTFDFEEVAAAAASLEAAARAMWAELGKPYVVLGNDRRMAETTRKNCAGF
jgi:hypothetical protein